MRGTNVQSGGGANRGLTQSLCTAGTPVNTFTLYVHKNGIIWKVTAVLFLKCKISHQKLIDVSVVLFCSRKEAYQIKYLRAHTPHVKLQIFLFRIIFEKTKTVFSLHYIFSNSFSLATFWAWILLSFFGWNIYPLWRKLWNITPWECLHILRHTLQT